MAATWPTSLQQLLNQSDFVLSPTDTTIRTDMDYGPKKVRRRYTDAVVPVNCSINLPMSEYDTLDLFFRNTLGGGVERFDFVHPITQDMVSARFTAPPSYAPMGGLIFRVSMQWEFLP